VESQLEAGAAGELAVVLQVSARRALDMGDGHAFIAWFCEIVPILAPVFVAPFGEDEVARRSALYAFGRLLWNRLPLPANHFRPLPLDKPQRNEPCPCGSGHKYKHCCARVETVADPFENVSLLDYVLRTYPRTELRKLPLSRLDLSEVAFIGNEWCCEGRAADAEALLEPIFDDIDRLDERAEAAFDALADCYTALGRTGKKARLVTRVAAARNPMLRSAALHRRITMLADSGKRAEAWRLFGEAQRHEPDNPMLATLEVTLLLEEGNHERVRERARFWIGRLARNRDYGHENLIGHLRKIAADPVEAVLEIECEQRPGLAELRRTIGSWPPVACHYRLERTDTGVWLEPDPILQTLEERWRETADVDEPDLTTISTGDPQALERAAPGIPWLRNDPLACQSFEVLDTLARVVRDAGLMAGRDALLEPLLERGRALLRLVLEQNGASDERVPWVVLGNRPALRLIAALFYLRQEQERVDDAREIARWMVCTLNPNDNHGLREELTRLLLVAEDAAGALRICDRYPDDMLLGTRLDRVLALFILGKHDDAAAALNEVVARSPDALPMLLAAAPKPPKGDGAYLRLGSKEEAWLYRDTHRELWERTGAIEWARAAGKRSGKRG
jgi:tetratricopeptide (TPR) repeat protein